MLELTPTTQALLHTTLALIGAVAFAFYIKQNRGEKMGGGISTPKAIWLGYAVYVWFFMAPILALDSNLAPSLRVIIGSFALSMWLRGIAELLMLYVWKNWRPPYGIAHNIVSMTILAFGSFWYRDHLLTLESNLDFWMLGFLIALFASMVCETYYAINFHDTVKGQTTGDDGVWFADATAPKFQRINRITAICNTPLVLFTSSFIMAWAS